MSSVIASPLGTPSTYREMGSDRLIRPWSTSCSTAVPENVFETLPIRMWSSTDMGAPVAVSAIPNART